VEVKFDFQLLTDVTLLKGTLMGYDVQARRFIVPLPVEFHVALLQALDSLNRASDALETGQLPEAMMPYVIRQVGLAETAVDRLAILLANARRALPCGASLSSTGSKLPVEPGQGG